MHGSGIGTGIELVSRVLGPSVGSAFLDLGDVDVDGVLSSMWRAWLGGWLSGYA